MFALRLHSRWWSVAVLAGAALGSGALGCTTPTEAHISKLQAPAVPDESVRSTPTFATLLSYDVVVPQDRAALLVAYCERTALPVQSEAGITRCGPFLSRYEAAFIAGLVPGASTRQHDQYMDGARLEPWRGLRAPYARTPVYAGTRLVAGHRFALVTWELGDDAAVEARRRLEAGPGPSTKDSSPPATETKAADNAAPATGKPASKGDAETAKPDSKSASKPDAEGARKPTEAAPKQAITEQELYEVLGGEPRLMTRLPRLDARRSAAGLAIAELSDESVYLEVKGTRQRGAISERLRAFQWDRGSSEAVFDREMLSLTKSESELVLSVTRVNPAARGLQLVVYKATFSRRPEAKGVDLELNDWSSPHWRPGKEAPGKAAPAGAKPAPKPPAAPARLPDLVDLKSVEPGATSFESLESLDASG